MAALFDGQSGNSTFERVAETPAEDIFFGGVRDAFDDLRDLATLQFTNTANAALSETVAAVAEVAGEDEGLRLVNALLDARSEEELAIARASLEAYQAMADAEEQARIRSLIKNRNDIIIVTGYRQLAREQAYLARRVQQEIRHSEIVKAAFERGRERAQGRYTLTELRARFGFEAPSDVARGPGGLYADAYNISDEDVAYTIAVIDAQPAAR